VAHATRAILGAIRPFPQPLSDAEIERRVNDEVEAMLATKRAGQRQEGPMRSQEEVDYILWKWANRSRGN
jgi:hypothetical protein